MTSGTGPMTSSGSVATLTSTMLCLKRVPVSFLTAACRRDHSDQERHPSMGQWYQIRHTNRLIRTVAVRAGRTYYASRFIQASEQASDRLAYRSAVLLLRVHEPT